MDFSCREEWFFLFVRVSLALNGAMPRHERARPAQSDDSLVCFLKCCFLILRIFAGFQLIMDAKNGRDMNTLPLDLS